MPQRRHDYAPLRLPTKIVPATTLGDSMVKIARLDDAFLEVFLDCKQAQ